MGLAGLGYLILGLTLFAGVLLAPLVTKMFFRMQDISNATRNEKLVKKAVKTKGLLGGAYTPAGEIR